MDLKPILLPQRYERLAQKALEINEDLARIVVKVEAGVSRVQAVFLEMSQSDVSRFEVFYGESGCGKTTFLETLRLFFDGVSVLKIGKTSQLLDAVAEIKAAAERRGGDRLVVYLAERDNPTESDDEILAFLEALRSLFRAIGPGVLVVWPLSLPEKADRLFKLAVKIGADSLVGSAAKYFVFTGPPREQFYRITDDTARLFNSGSALLDYGIDEALGTGVFCDASTLGGYFGRILELSNQINGVVAGVLKEKPHPRLWIVVVGDETTELMGTVQALTHGNQREFDTSRFAAGVGQRRAETQYLKNWQGLGEYMTYLLRVLDVRVLELPPNVALSIVRAFGDQETRAPLRKKTESKSVAADQLKESILGELLLGNSPRDRRSARKTAGDTRAEYQRFQQSAKTHDYKLNHAVAAAIREMFAREGGGGGVTSEKKAVFGSIVPDVAVGDVSLDPVWLEFTWRTTGNPAAEGIALQQNTLSQGHIQKYVLEKAYDCVIALGLGEMLQNRATGFLPDEQ